MKRILSALLIFLLVCALFAGCGEQQPQPAEPSGPVTVRDVDELLAAIAPGARIVMEAGHYLLSGASDYGEETEGKPYSWEIRDDGYQLVIDGVRNLTIQGSGADSTVLATEPVYADILVFRSCDNLVLQDFSCGYSGRGEYGGMDLNSCTNVHMKGLIVSGCGTVGLRMDNCRNVLLSDSMIQECGFVGIQAQESVSLTVENCTLRAVGSTPYGGSTVFRLAQSSDVRITGCSVLDNSVDSLIDCYPCDNVVFEQNTFSGNRVQRVALDVDGGMIFDNNIVEDNVIPAWFASESATVLDGIGKSWNGEMLQWYYNPPAQQLPEGEQEEIHVSTVDQLLEAIGPNRQIILEEAFYDLSAAKNYGTGFTDYYYWSEEFDGPSLVIMDVENMTIRSASDDLKACTISAVPRYANVLSFLRCSNVTLFGFTAGHTVEPGYCMGGVLYFRNCDNILTENCGLYGCGILGVQAERSSVITVKDCDIYECSYGGIQMSEVTDVVIENCVFRDLGGDSMAFFDCKNVTVEGRTVSGNARIS